MKQEYKLEELEKFLRDNDIPKIKANPKTFLGIAKQPHYENVLSNIYAFFFDPNEEHGLKDLFVSSFVEIINEKLNISEKEPKFEISYDFDIHTEFSTQKRGRIDLLLVNDSDAIIIENKVYHYLNNDLVDYWNSIESSNKKGVVLSLNKIHQTGHDQFVNITHIEFLNKVMSHLGHYLIYASDKYLVFLKDFYQNIVNLSNQMETKDLKFYFKHIETLNDIAKLKFAVRDYIKNEVNEAMSIINFDLDLDTSRGELEKRLRYYISKRHYDLMFTVVFSELLDSRKTLWIMVELSGKAVQNKEEYRDLNFNDTEKAFLNPEFYTTKGNWAHFVRKPYVLEDSEIENLSDFIANKIKDEPFLSIFIKLEEYLTEKRNK